MSTDSQIRASSYPNDKVTSTGMPVPREFTLGAIVGRYRDQPIYQDLTDDHGIVRVFSGVAIDSSCKPGGVIIEPGLLYEIV
jgi:hypothetical protein